MAKSKPKISIPGVGEIDPDWATEETMDGILKILEKKYGKSGSGGKSDKARKKEAEAIKLSSNAYKKTAGEAKKREAELKKKYKERVAQLNAFIRSNSMAAEALDIVSDTGKLAGKAFKNLKGKVNSLSDKTGNVVNSIDNLDGSVSSANSAFMQLVGGAGAFGAVLGFAAGVIDEFIDFQTSAIQRGFSFSQGLVDMRTDIASVGLRMRQLADVINMNGEALSYLGSNGQKATHTFIDMLDKYKQGAIQFGYFGDTTEEMAMQLISQVDVLRRSGMDRNQVENQAVKNLLALNQETFAMAKLTGRNRRDLERERLDGTKDNALLLHNLNQLGPEGAKSFETFKTAFAAAFDSDSPVTDMVIKTLETAFAGGQLKLSPDEIAVMNSIIPGLGDQISEVARILLDEGAGDGLSLDEILPAVTSIASLLNGQKKEIGDMIELLGSDSSLGSLLLGILHSTQEAQTLLSKDAAEVASALKGNMPDLEREALALRDNIMVLQNEFNASILRLFGFDKLEDFANEEKFNEALEKIKGFGDVMARINEFIVNLDSAFIDNGNIFDELVLGATLFFAAKGAFAMAMIGGAQLTWALISKLLLGRAVATGAGAAAGAGAAGEAARRRRGARVRPPTPGGAGPAGGIKGAGTNLIKGLVKAGKYALKWGPVTAGITAALTPTTLGDGTLSPELAESNAPTQESIDAEALRIQRSKIPNFEDLDFFEQQEMRNNTPGSRGAMDALRASGAPFDAEAHAIVSGRYQGSSPEELRTYLERVAKAMEENNRLMRQQNEILN